MRYDIHMYDSLSEYVNKNNRPARRPRIASLDPFQIVVDICLDIKILRTNVNRTTKAQIFFTTLAIIDGLNIETMK